MTLAYARTHGLDVCVTRGCNTYGPYQYPEKVIPLFVTNLLDGLSVPLYGDGGNVRAWVHVDDHCRGIQLVLSAGEPGRVYHVGGNAELTNLALTRLVLEHCGAGWDKVTRVPDRKGHDRRYSLDDSRLRAMGYAPGVPFAAGLADVVRWYRENRSWWEPLKEGAAGGPGCSRPDPALDAQGPTTCGANTRSQRAVPYALPSVIVALQIVTFSAPGAMTRRAVNGGRPVRVICVAGPGAGDLTVKPVMDALASRGAEVIGVRAGRARTRRPAACPRASSACGPTTISGPARAATRSGWPRC